MIALDTNVLVYAHRRDSPRHAVASRELRELSESMQPWGLPWPCVHEFLSVVTRPRYFERPSTVAEARRQVDTWLSSPSVRLLTETTQHWQTLCRVLDRSDSVGPGVHDAKIAAICIDNGVSEIVTGDVRFSNVPPLRVRNPFA